MTAGLINKYSQKMARNVKYLSLLKNLICSPGAWLQNFLMLTNFFSATVLVCFQGNKCTYTTLHTFLIIKFYNLPGSFVLFFLSLSLPFSLNGQLLNLLVFFLHWSLQIQFNFRWIFKYLLTKGLFQSTGKKKIPNCQELLWNHLNQDKYVFFILLLFNVQIYCSEADLQCGLMCNVWLQVIFRNQS